MGEKKADGVEGGGGVGDRRGGRRNCGRGAGAVVVDEGVGAAMVLVVGGRNGGPGQGWERD